MSVDDNGGSLTVDNAGLTELAAAINASSQLDVNIAASAATLTVASHAVTNAGTFPVQADAFPATVHSADFDTGAGTDTTLAFGIAVPASGGAAVVPGDATAGLKVDLGADNDVTVTGTVTANLAAGTNNIGDVDVLSVVPGTGATNLGKAVDSASGATDTGVAPLFVRDDSLSALTPIEGDYVPGRVDANGAIHVRVSAGGVAGIAEDSASAGGEEGVMMLAVRRDVASSGVSADGDFAALSVTSDGSLRVSGSSGTTQYAEDVASAGGESLCLAGAVRQDTIASNTSLDGDYTYLKTTAAGRLYTSATVDAALPAGTNNIGDVDVLSIAAGDNNIGNVDVVTMPNVTLAAGTNTNEVVGDAADDAATAGNPVLVGGVAVETDGTDPTTVSAEGDAAYLRTDRARRLLVSEHHPRSFFTSADYAAAQTNTSVQAAPGAGLSLYITDIVISNGATAGNITLLDGSAGTVKFEIYPAINGGVSISLRQPIRLTANTALCITSTTVTTHSVNIGGYTAP